MQPPDPEHVFILSKWTQELIMGLVFILTMLIRLIGLKFGGDKKMYVTIEQLMDCSDSVGTKIEKLENKIDGYMQHITDRIDNMKD